MLTILVDVDDTSGDLLTTWVEDINKTFGTTLKRSDIKSWAINEYVPNHDLRNESVYDLLTGEMYDENGLDRSAMNGVCTGRRPHHKGWTRFVAH